MGDFLSDSNGCVFDQKKLKSAEKKILASIFSGNNASVLEFW